MTNGQGFKISASSKKKLNTKSSTKSEILGVDQLTPSVLWTRMFFYFQVFGVTENIIYQDNKSVIILENNGTLSSSKLTKHINISFFGNWKDQQRRYISAEWCPTGEMTGYF